MEQAIVDSKETKIPIVVHRKNRTKWLVTMRARDWIPIALLYEQISKGSCGSGANKIWEECLRLWTVENS
jgi:hypothetical protein